MSDAKPVPLEDKALDHARHDYVQIAADQTLAEALAQIQRQENVGRIVYFYVADGEGRLCGILPTRRLLLNPPQTKVADVMVKNPVALPADATVLDACEFFIQHRFLALPIVDAERNLLGVIDVEIYTQELSDIAAREENEDIFQLIGVRVAQVQQKSLPVVFARRFPWLLCNIGGGLACAFIAGMFEAVLAEVIALALFIPVVLALAESVAIQTLTLTLQAHHGLAFSWRQILKELAGQAPIGVSLGLASGGLVALVSWIWHGQPGVAGVILLSITAAVTTAAMLGLIVPALLGAFRRDPKVASGPLALALTDMLTLVYYFGLATLWLG